MGGLGRNIGTIKEFEPKDITLVDINHLSIDKVMEDFKDDKSIKAHCKDIDGWIQKDNSQYGVIIGIWVLSYLDGPAVDRFLKWANKHSKYILLVEPTH